MNLCCSVQYLHFAIQVFIQLPDLLSQLLYVIGFVHGVGIHLKGVGTHIKCLIWGLPHSNTSFQSSIEFGLEGSMFGRQRKAAVPVHTTPPD